MTKKKEPHPRRSMVQKDLLGIEIEGHQDFLLCTDKSAQRENALRQGDHELTHRDVITIDTVHDAIG